MDKWELEKRVMRKVAGNIFKAGLSIKVTCHGDIEPVGETEFHTKLTKAFMADTTCADMLDWDVYKDGKPFSSALLVLGECGYDVICDHGTNLTPYMPTDKEMDRYESLLTR